MEHMELESSNSIDYEQEEDYDTDDSANNDPNFVLN